MTADQPTPFDYGRPPPREPLSKWWWLLMGMALMMALCPLDKLGAP